MLDLLLAAVLAGRVVSARWCAHGYWTGRCTACPGYWYQNCNSGYGENSERGCGFLGCEIYCYNSRKSYDHGCGCGAGTGCLPVNCEVNNWGGWSSCSKNCGSGSQSRTRSIRVQPKNNGRACPATSESRSCNTHHCPVHCQVSGFGGWQACSKSCGGGTQKRVRTITQNPAHGGNSCPGLQENRACNDNPCPVHCQVSGFGAWGACDAECNGGVQSRKRSVTVEPKHNGNKCPALEEKQACNEHNCPLHCEVSAWGGWEDCSKTCGGGARIAKREVTQENLYGGTACPGLQKSESCNTQGCPVDCVVSDWTAFSTCTETCGKGSQTRTRSITTSPENGGEACPPVTETVNCNEHPCPIHCVVGDFGDFDECSKTCGSGMQKRERPVTTAPEHGGNACPDLTSSQSCNTNPCPVDCQVSEFGDFGECSEPCGGGMKERKRVVTVAAQHGGETCPGLVEKVACNEQECPIDCVQTDWSDWSECSLECGGGEMTRDRIVTTAAEHGGAECGHPEEKETCNDAPCPVDCQVSMWTEYGACSATCGTGTQTRTRVVTQDDLHGGEACPDLEESQDCNTNACPIDCVVGAFPDFPECPATCGGHTVTRTREVTTEAENGGAECPALDETKDCGSAPCPVDCVIGDWGEWRACTVSCGGGERARAREIMTDEAHGGEPCPALEEKEVCGTDECPKDCVLSDWSEFSGCSEACGSGTKNRIRFILEEAVAGGDCVDESLLTETVACNDGPCPIDCVVSAFGEWGACSLDCGGGEQKRSRVITTAAEHGGDECPVLEETRGCNEDPCVTPAPTVVDCQVTEWTQWNECSATCEGGSRNRARFVEVEPSANGAGCGDLTEDELCNLEMCPTPEPTFPPSNEPTIEEISATPAPTMECGTFTYYQGICLTSSVDNDGRYVKKDCQNRGCNYSDGACTAYEPGTKMKCKKLKFEMVAGDKGAGICECFPGCNPQYKTKGSKKKYKKCGGSFKFQST